jgi:hypothetical protein
MLHVVCSDTFSLIVSISSPKDKNISDWLRTGCAATVCMPDKTVASVVVYVANRLLSSK